MSATTWLIIAIVGFSLSGIALITAVFMFIKMNILSVIGDLSGRTVAREIKAMRDANASSGDKLHKSSQVNVNRGKLTEKVEDGSSGKVYIAQAHASKRLDKVTSETSSELSKSVDSQNTTRKAKGMTTESLSANVGEVDISKNGATDVLPDERHTDILSPSNQTEVLNQNNGTEILSSTRQTEVLSDNSADDAIGSTRNGTTVLSETIEDNEIVREVLFRIVRSELIIHTEEIIGKTTV